MALHCAISNTVPEVPVVSPTSGSIFERRLIEKYIDENGTDPVSGEQLTKEMLVELKTPSIVKPKPPSASSIPAILKSLQDEWDATMIHAFSLRQQLQTVRQELSHALYQHDAACRVIARQNKELAAAREALATLQPRGGIPHAAIQQPVPVAEIPGAAAAPLAEAGLTPEIVQKLQETGNALTTQRKERGKAVPEDLTPADSIKQFRTIASHPGLHSASTPGILALDIHAADTGKLVTGGNDKTATVFNKDTEQVVAILKGHTKKVSHVIYHPTEDTVISASPDSTIRVWNVPSAQNVCIVRAHSAAITGLSLHATGDYVLSTSSDEHWAFTDIRAGGRLLTRGTSGVGLTSAQFHPDGLIFATGASDSVVRIWDLKERNNVADFPGHAGAITAISFSENGYYLATAAADASVKLWDLRKLRNFRSIPMEAEYEITDVCFDHSGNYLAVAGTDVRVYLAKQWTELKVFNDHTALATGVRFGKNASYMASVSMDRTLKIYGQ